MRASLQILYLLMDIQFSSVAQSCPTLCDPMNQLMDIKGILLAISHECI